MSSTTAIILILLALVLVVAAIAIAKVRRTSSRRNQLKHRFGPEYERALEDFGNSDQAERELLHRERRVHQFHVHDLSSEARERHAQSWRAIQRQFVDNPQAAVAEADGLIKIVMRDRGYPIERFEQRVADLSVEHANVVQHYRAARALAEVNRRGAANTEELRQALVHYRALFSDLLGGQAQESPHHYQELTA